MNKEVRKVLAFCSFQNMTWWNIHRVCFLRYLPFIVISLSLTFASECFGQGITELNIPRKGNVTDHQGNVRVVAGPDGGTEEVSHYYPYGALMGESRSAANQPYKYNGKELDRIFGLDWYDYGARMYDPVLGRWTTMDPMAVNYYDVSPYAYCHDNSVNRVDPDGADDYFSQSGIYLYSSGMTPNIYIRQGKSNILFQKFDLRSRRNMQMAANIVGHYAREVGVSYNMNGGEGTVGLSTLHAVRNPNALAATTNGNIFIKMTNGHLNKELYNIHNLRGTLRHENEHKKDFDSRIRNIGPERHAEIIINETSNKDFLEGTSEYQLGQIGQLQGFLTDIYNDNKKAYQEVLRKANVALIKAGYKIDKDDYNKIK